MRVNTSSWNPYFRQNFLAKHFKVANKTYFKNLFKLSFNMWLITL